jgi:hypothetical protein
VERFRDLAQEVIVSGKPDDDDGVTVKRCPAGMAP